VLIYSQSYLLFMVVLTDKVSRAVCASVRFECMREHERLCELKTSKEIGTFHIRPKHIDHRNR
jgi:hypothetical protein